jgi:hypothetical protein
MARRPRVPVGLGTARAGRRRGRGKAGRAGRRVTAKKCNQHEQPNAELRRSKSAQRMAAKVTEETDDGF